MRPVPHTYLLDTPVWRAQGPRAWAAGRGLGPATTSDWLHRGAGEEAYTGGGQAGSIPSPGHPAWHPMVHLSQTPHPSSPPHEAVTVLNPTFQMERQRLGRDLSQASWQWMKDCDSGHSGPQRVTGTLELRHSTSTRTPGNGHHRLVFSSSGREGV